ncbi:hypothetical protein HYV50_03195 [Candidatus Pacearchaeota archaeon]|nr:hypothetical protein [Candidatus Pacearchaeota archaeon]
MADDLPEILDKAKGVILEINTERVYVSLYRGEDEYVTDLDRKYFEENNVPLRQGEGFDFEVEKYSNGREEIIVKPHLHLPITPEVKERIEKEIRELLD